MKFSIPEPELQAIFARSLREIRALMLQDALRKTVGSLDVPTIDRELAEVVPSHSLTILAGHGLRGELMFPVPCIIMANPRLVGYYRLLYGFSQKEFHKPGIGSAYKSAELSGKLSKTSAASLPEFCKAMSHAGALLLPGIGAGNLDASILDDLTLLTLGPQLRGGANVAAGTAGIAAVFGVVKEIVEESIQDATTVKITLKNAAGRTVFIEFAADPDIIIREQLKSGAFRHIIAIEVKAGRDFSNIHNRIGEAEKSHQKARSQGYTECWTVVNVNKIDIETAKRESPSTDRFYKISDLVAATGPDFIDFRERVTSLTGIS